MEQNLRFKKIRHQLNLQQKEIAEKTGISTRIVQNIEQGKQKVTIQIAQKLEEVFNVDIKWLLFGDGEMFITETSLIQSRNELFEFFGGEEQAKKFREVFKSKEDLKLIELVIKAKTGNKVAIAELKGLLTGLELLNK